MTSLPTSAEKQNDIVESCVQVTLSFWVIEADRTIETFPSSDDLKCLVENLRKVTGLAIKIKQAGGDTHDRNRGIEAKLRVMRRIGQSLRPARWQSPSVAAIGDSYFGRVRFG